MYYIGIDIGTSSVKVLAIDEAGKIVKTVSREYPISYPFPLWSEQNPNDWWEQSKLALKDILEYIDKVDYFSSDAKPQNAVPNVRMVW